jgi:DNA-directed RNA polymerase subunit F
MNMLEENVVSHPEAKKLLEKKAKEKELGYEQKNALEHLRKFSKLSEKDARELEEGLRKVERLKPRHIANITNLMPQDENDLKIVFSSDTVSLSEEEKKQILHAVKKFK